MKLFIIVPLFISSVTIHAQLKLSHDDSLLIGTWKGTSICQVKPSACNDEIAAYHVTKGDRPNSYHMVMNKVVNGVEEDMGESDYGFDPEKRILKCVEERYKLTVTFHLDGDKMDGALVLFSDPNKPWRIIKLRKDNSK